MKITICLAVALLLLLLYFVDVLIAGGYKIELLSVSPDPVYADERITVHMKVRLTHGGNPVEGHEMTSLAVTGGSFKNSRAKTGKDGTVEFLYIPYRSSTYLKAQPVEIVFADDSNSLFVSVPAKLTTILPLLEPETEGTDNNSVNDFF